MKGTTPSMLWTDFDSIDHAVFMREALIEAAAALRDGDLAIGAVIVFDGVVVARGRNRIHSDHSQLAHAEIVALQAGGEFLFRRFEECVIYSTQEPCVICLGAIAMVMCVMQSLALQIRLVAVQICSRTFPTCVPRSAGTSVESWQLNARRCLRKDLMEPFCLGPQLAKTSRRTSVCSRRSVAPRAAETQSRSADR